MIFKKNGFEIYQIDGEKRVEIWKDKKRIRSLTASKADLKIHELEKILDFYTAMEDM